MAESSKSNFISGMSSGAKKMGMGIAAGGAACVAMPFASASKCSSNMGIVGGALGFTGGIVAGVAVMGLAAGVGVGAGIYEVGKGFVDTPGAITAFVRDDDLHGKEKIDLQEIEEIDLAQQEHDTAGNRAVLDEALEEPEYQPRNDVKDRKLYDVLGAEPNAPASVLKRKYYVLAKKEHPDKGGDTQKFQAISDAYAVLSDAKKRKKYDEEGLEGLQEHKNPDPGVAFAMMFGNQKFIDISGDLTQVMTMRVAEDDRFETKEKKEEEVKRLQKVRDQQLAKKLALRLDRWANADDAGKEEWLKEHLLLVDDLRNAQLGAQMCICVGIMYELVADSSLGYKSRLSQLGFGASNDYHKTKTMARALQAALELQKMQAAKEDPENNVDSGKMEEAIFNVMALDIEAAVGAASRLALADTSVDKAQRQARAQGMLKLGRIFQGNLPAAEAAGGDTV